MKRIFAIALLTLIITHTGLSQQTLVLTFTAIDSASYVQLDSIKIMNRTQGGDTVLYCNDTVLVLKLGVGFPDINSRKDGFQLRSYPNPLTDHATIEISVPEQGEVKLSVTDVLGRQLLEVNRDIHPGTHTFRFIPGNDRLYFLTATWNGYRRTIKMVNSSDNPGRQCTISYQGYKDQVSTEKSHTASRGFEFSLGDMLLYIGYVNALESGMSDSPDSSQTYTFQFAHNIPCPGTPTVTYEGQVYNTVQIFSQCWLKENLNVGEIIDSLENMTNNGVIEKYCHQNSEDSCLKYGGLYQWNEIMQYSTLPITQGICPDGWHIPSDEEYKILEGSVDSHYLIGDSEWDIEVNKRGFDVGMNLKSKTGWRINTGTDLYDFTALASGCRLPWYGIVCNQIIVGQFWTATEKYTTGYAWRRLLRYDMDKVYRDDVTKQAGYSVRCIKD